jgi:hypothetical protein
MPQFSVPASEQQVQIELHRSLLRGINSLQRLQNQAASCGELDLLF